VIILQNKNPQKNESGASPGILYVVATPLGNRDDITLRALKVLQDADLIAAEDTRKTRNFLTLHDIQNQLISYHEYNEKERTPELIARLQAGLSVALVSNAGTPAVSDPGYRLVEAAIANRLNVIPIPGVSAVTAALSVAGLPTDSFIFMGFPPKKKAGRLQQLNDLAGEPRTLIFYESPKRIRSLLSDLIDILGDRRGFLAREMTKLHEEFLRGRLSEITGNLRERPGIKGECTLLVAGCGKRRHQSWGSVAVQIETAVKAEEHSLSAIAREIAASSGYPKNKIYTEALRISKELSRR
jgi:16S rRNA (cytidine1402-2'-O)-methyltransferase